MEVDGQRRDSRRLLHNGFNFHLDSRYANKTPKRYLCSSRITSDYCRVKLWLYENGRIEVNGDHNHRNPDIQQREPIIRQLQHQASASDLPPSQIVNNVLRNLPNAADLIQVGAGRQIINRQRRLHRPPLPNNFEDLDTMLLAYQRIQNIYQGKVVAEDESIAYIFGSNAMLLHLGEVAEWHVDGTFQCVPLRPRAAQLLIIHIRRMDVGIPALYILCSRRTTAMYNSIFRWIITRVPAVRQSLQTIVSDFEIAILSSIRTCMPWVNRRGCWFHFARAVTRKWNSLRLPERNEPDHRILQLSWVLPLVPAERFEEALDIIFNLVEPIANDNFFLFARYLRRFWLPLANIVSVYNTPWRTNNIAEIFNRYLLSKLGTHPTFFEFLSHLIQLINDDGVQWNRLNNGLDLGRHRRRRQHNMDLFIQHIQESLESRRYSMAEFLEIAVVRRIEVQFQLDAAVTRQQYLDDDLTMEEGLQVDHIRNDEADGGGNMPDLPAFQVPVDVAVPENDINYYANEIILADEPEAPWIQASTEGMIFEDQLAQDANSSCRLCLTNEAKVIFYPCGHLSLCLECKFKMEISAPRDELMQQQNLICVVCQSPSTSLMTIY